MFSSHSTPLKGHLRVLHGLMTGTRLRRLVYAFLLSCIAFQTSAPVLQAAPVVPCGFTEIRGVVTAKDSGKPLPGVAVYASHELGFTNTDTDPTGAYTLTLPYYLDPGPYSIELYPDFGSELPTKAYLSPPVTVTHVVSGETTILNAALERGGSIQGQVRTADTDEPMEGLLLTAYRHVGDEFIFGSSADTDAEGNYTMYGLEPGNYVLRYDSLNIFSTPAIQKYETGYLGRVNYPSESTPISIPSAITKTIDFSIPVGSAIVGEIHRSDTNDIVSSVTVQAYLLDESGSGRGDLISVSNGSDFGTYYVGSLAPGKYLLAAQPERTVGGEGKPQYGTSWDLDFEWYKDVETSKEAKVVEIPKISPSQPISVDFTLSPSAMITGMVTDADTGAPVPGIGVRILNYTATAEINVFYGYALAVETDDRGIYEIAGVRDGHYQLVYSPPYQSDYDVVGRPFTTGVEISIAGTEVHPNANFSVHRGGSIDGTLTDNKAKAVPGIKVSLLRTSDQSLVTSTTSDSTGKYSFPKVAPGQYLVKFNRFDPCGCYNNDLYTGEGENKSGLVTVQVGKATTGINSTMACNAAPPANSIFLPRVQPGSIR